MLSRVSLPVRADTRDIDDVPTWLPDELYMPELSDLLHPLEINDGQVLAAELIAHPTGTRTWGARWDRAHQNRRASQLITAFALLEEQGRAEGAWLALIRAARAVAAGQIGSGPATTKAQQASRSVTG